MNLRQQLKLIFLSLFFTQILSAQTFTELIPSDFEGVANSSIAFSDVDGDNDQDVLITGGATGSGQTTKLYLNNGAGNFTEVTGTPFVAVEDGSIAFSDVDGDNDPDVLITGSNNSISDRIAKLYINDGQGNFSEVTGTPFEGVWESSVAFSDVDGDNDQDVLIVGQNSSDDRISKLYVNDGLGNFSELQGTPFVGVSLSSIAFSDVNGDNNSDVLITGATGMDNSVTPTARLYLNDGMGNFSELMGTPFETVSIGSVAFSDVDGDNDSDVIITGADSTFLESFIKLYLNDGLGNFTEMAGTPFDAVILSSIAFSDVDGDNDPDVLITGLMNFTDRISKLYTNDGLGNFTEVTGTPFEGVTNGSMAFSDVDGDNDPDVLITGFDISDEPIAKLYLNDILSSTDKIRSEFNFALTLYPNPVTSSQLKVDLNSIENGFLSVKIYGLNGQLLSEQKKLIRVGQQTISVDISGLSAGSYLIHLENGGRKSVSRFMVP